MFLLFQVVYAKQNKNKKQKKNPEGLRNSNNLLLQLTLAVISIGPIYWICAISSFIDLKMPPE